MKADLGRIYDETVTIVNVADAKSAGTQYDVYQKHELSHCMWSIRTDRTVEADGTVSIGTTHVVQVPESEDYLPYREWLKLEDRSKKFTISAGDYVIRGSVPEEIDSGNYRKVVAKYEPDAFEVQSFRDATKGAGFDHSTRGALRFAEPYIIEG